MASRKEQKEQLRKEREEREAAAKAEQRRRQLIGYGAAGVVILIAVVVGAVILLGGSDSSSGPGPGETGEVLPDGGEVPDQKETDLTAAAKAAGCTLKDYPGKSREHTGDLAEKVEYDSNPPSEGKHFQVPAEDGAYEESPDQKELVHTLEHGRVIIWFKPTLPEDDRANLKALFDEDTYHMVITPDKTMTPVVAATAWNRGPTDNGTGRTLTCSKITPQTYDAIRAFRDEHRDNGPETVP